MAVLLILALLAILAFGIGFTIHWLFVVAIIAALCWVIAVLVGGAGRRRGAWW